MPPRKSSEKAENAALRIKREQQHKQMVENCEKIDQTIEKIKQMQKEYALLSSVLDGLYEEIDKLCKKAPAEQVTELVLEQINDIIRAIKDLAKEDPYVQKQKEFVPAGDNPELRDAVVVLKQLRQGLDRFEGTIEPRIKSLYDNLEEATTVRIALDLYLKDDDQVVPNDIENLGYISSGRWFVSNGYGSGRTFNWTRLDGIDLEKYFSVL